MLSSIIPKISLRKKIVIKKKKPETDEKQSSEKTFFDYEREFREKLRATFTSQLANYYFLKLLFENELNFAKWFKQGNIDDKYVMISPNAIYPYFDKNVNIGRYDIFEMKLGSHYGYAESLYCLSMCYLFGKGVTKDTFTGLELLKNAAKKKHKFAKLFLDIFDKENEKESTLSIFENKEILPNFPD